MSEEELEARLWAWDLFGFPKPGWLRQALDAFLSHNPKTGAGPIELLGLALSRQDRLWLGAYPGAWQITRDPTQGAVFDAHAVFVLHDGQDVQPVAHAQGLDALYARITQPDMSAPAPKPKPKHQLGAGPRKAGPTLRLV